MKNLINTAKKCKNILIAYAVSLVVTSFVWRTENLFLDRSSFTFYCVIGSIFLLMYLLQKLIQQTTSDAYERGSKDVENHWKQQYIEFCRNAVSDDAVEIISDDFDFDCFDDEQEAV